jgi:phage protein D
MKENGLRNTHKHLTRMIIWNRNWSWPVSASLNNLRVGSEVAVRAGWAGTQHPTANKGITVLCGRGNEPAAGRMSVRATRQRIAHA